MISDTSRLVYPFYGFLADSVSHLFVTCEIVSSVRYRVFRWLGRQVATHQDLMVFFRIFFHYETWLSLEAVT